MICMMAREGSLDDGLRPGGIARATGVAAMLRQVQRHAGRGGDRILPNPGG
jgi:hypothetical protein